MFLSVHPPLRAIAEPTHHSADIVDKMCLSPRIIGCHRRVKAGRVDSGTRSVLVRQLPKSSFVPTSYEIRSEVIFVCPLAVNVVRRSHVLERNRELGGINHQHSRDASRGSGSSSSGSWSCQGDIVEVPEMKTSVPGRSPISRGVAFEVCKVNLWSFILSSL